VSLKLEFVNITQLSEAEIIQMGRVRFRNMPPIVKRSMEADIELFRASLRNFLVAGLARSGDGEIEGFLLFSSRLREWRGRYWVWLHGEDASMDAHFRGARILDAMAFRATVRERLRHPLLPIYGLSMIFPSGYMKIRALGPAYAWGQRGLPEWHAGLLDYMAPEIAEHRPLCRQEHIVQLSVTSESEPPQRFRDPRRRLWLEEYEALAPRWREGRVPIVLYPISVQALLLAAIRHKLSI
jgi:hypothetical protein